QRWSTPRSQHFCRKSALFFFDLLGEVVLQADLLDQGHLRFEPVDVLFLLGQDLFEEVAGVVVAFLPADLDAFVEAGEGVELEGVVGLEDLRDVLADVDLAEALDVGDAVEEEDTLDQFFGMLHLADGVLADDLVEPVVAPVLAHLAVDEVLVDGGELAGQDFVQDLDDFRVALHECLRRVAAAEPITRYSSMLLPRSCAGGTLSSSPWQAAWAVSARARSPRWEMWQEPHWSPMPQRWRSRTVAAPWPMALSMSRSDLPRQMQMITRSFPFAGLRLSLNTVMMTGAFQFVKIHAPHASVTIVTTRL